MDAQVTVPWNTQKVGTGGQQQASLSLGVYLDNTDTQIFVQMHTDAHSFSYEYTKYPKSKITDKH